MAIDIISTVLTKTQFELIQQNITDQVSNVEEAGILALSGLHYVVQLNIDAPEIDLVNPMYAQLQRMSAISGSTNWTPIVAALNTHAFGRGAPSAVGTPTQRLNAYLENGGNRILVSQTYANLSAATGMIIDDCYVTPGSAGGCLPGITSTLPLVNGNVSVPFSYVITAVGTPTITFEVTSDAAGLITWPGANGLSFVTDTISGTPGSAVSTIVYLKATNGLGSVIKQLTIVVSA